MQLGERRADRPIQPVAERRVGLVPGEPLRQREDPFSFGGVEGPDAVTGAQSNIRRYRETGGDQVAGELLLPADLVGGEAVRAVDLQGIAAVRGVDPEDVIDE